MNEKVTVVKKLNFSIYVLLFSFTTITACGGGNNTTSNPLPPDKLDPVPEPEPVLDHSGLSPLTSDIIDNSEYLSGGDVTLFLSNDKAFETRPDLIKGSFTLDGLFTQGDHLFRTAHNDSGPLMNSDSCQSCHINDGRGEMPKDSSEPFISTLVKIADVLGNADPMYGDQLQTFAEQSFNTSDLMSGLPIFDGSLNGDQLYGEAYTFVEYDEVTGSYPDGTQYRLRSPVNKIKDLSFGPFIEDIQFSVRVAPAVFGSGLLGAIPQANILALVDEDDTDNDGISGRASMVTNVLSNKTVLGRFAYKAQAPSVLQQSAGAYRGDMGLTNSMFVDESCTDNQTACQVVAERESKVDEKL